MKSIFLVLLLSMAAFADAPKSDNVCYPKALVEKWNKHKRKPVKQVVVEKIVDRQIIVDRVVVKSAPKNNLSLLGGRTETGLKADGSYPVLKSHTTGELDIGLMYQRSLGKNWKASVIGTKNGSFYGGIGYDFNLFGE